MIRHLLSLLRRNEEVAAQEITLTCGLYNACYGVRQEHLSFSAPCQVSPADHRHLRLRALYAHAYHC